MAIADLQAKQGNVEITADIISKEEPREFQKFGKPGRVCNAILKDDSGQIKLTLWNEQIDKVNIGDKVQIKNGYVSEWQGEKQLSTGKFGSLEIVGKSENASKDKDAGLTQSKPAAKTDSETTVFKNFKEKDKSLDVAEEDLDVDEEDVD